jgi:hypothetical protein
VKVAARKPIENAAAKDVKALDRLFAKSLKAAAPAARGPRSAPRPAAAAATAVAEPISDDDVPF